MPRTAARSACALLVPTGLAALQVWGVEVEVQGPEVPILDGSALPFAEALLDAGMEGLGDRAPTRLRPRREARFTVRLRARQQPIPAIYLYM